jgi:Protein of unknown function (DUF5818)
MESESRERKPFRLRRDFPGQIGTQSARCAAEGRAEVDPKRSKTEMKRLNLGALVPSLALAAGLLCLQPTLRAQSTPQDQPQTSPQTPQDQGQAGQPAQPAQTFTGKITKAGGKLVLKDSATNTEYQLDDQQKAASFEGKDVKVTGTLDAQNNTIHVSDIQAAAPGA